MKMLAKNAIGAILTSIFALAPIVVVTASRTARAEELNPPSIEDLRVGFDGHFKTGHWTPVEITFLGGSAPYVGQVKLMLPDGDGTPSIVTAPRPVQLLPGKRTKVLMYAKFGNGYGSLRVLFRADEKNVIDETFDTNGGPGQLVLPLPLQPNERLIVTLGASVGVEEASRLHQQATAVQTAIAVLRDANDLPTEWYGYDSVDWIVISTSQPELFAKMFATGARRAALAQWVDLGGNLLLTVGAEAPRVLAADAPLAGFAPGRLAEQTTLRRTTDLESFVGGSRKVRPGQDGELALSVPRLENVAGKVEVADGNRPLVVRMPRRFGQVVFVGVDLDQRPFLDWEGRGPLVVRLLGLSEPGTSNAAAKNNAGRPAGMGSGWDLLYSLRGGLDNFRGVTPISFAVVAAMILGYIVLIGPGDYFLVKNLLKRMELTWITFPLWVALVSMGAYALAVYTKGDDLRLNQVDLVDVDVDSGWARGTSWLNVFSPRSEAFDLTVEPHEPSGKPVAENQRLIAWLGSGEHEIGSNSGSMFSGRYDFSPQLDELIRVPIQVWSTKGFLGRSTYKTSEMVTGELTQGPNGVPEGIVRNDLLIPLTQCTLVSGSWAYVLGDLQPGETARLKPGEQRDLKHVLPSARQDYAPGYNAYGTRRSASDVSGTLERMLFFKAAGGEESGNQSNGNQQYVDFSALLGMDRAILVAHADRQAAQLTNAGKPLAGPEDQHWTVYRFVFPVNRTNSARE